MSSTQQELISNESVERSQRQQSPPNFISKIFTSSSSPWQPHWYLIYYFCIFFSGIFFAVVFLIVLNRWPPPYQPQQQQPQQHNIPQQHYLQVRDEFLIDSTYFNSGIAPKSKSKEPPPQPSEGKIK